MVTKWTKQPRSGFRGKPQTVLPTTAAAAAHQCQSSQMNWFEVVSGATHTQMYTASPRGVFRGTVYNPSIHHLALNFPNVNVGGMCGFTVLPNSAFVQLCWPSSLEKGPLPTEPIIPTKNMQYEGLFSINVGHSIRMNPLQLLLQLLINICRWVEWSPGGCSGNVRIYCRLVSN